MGSKISEFKSKLLGGNKPSKKKNIFGEPIEAKETSSNNTKDFAQITGDATNRVVSRRLNMGLNTNQLRSLDKLNMLCGAKKSGEENIKKVANITSKLEGGGRSKLMSFMKNDDGLSTLEGFSKMANEKDKKLLEQEERKAEEEKKENEVKAKNEEKKENPFMEEKKEEIKTQNEDNKKENKNENEENKKENNEVKKENEEKEKEKEKEKPSKPKRVKNALRGLRGLDL